MYFKILKADMKHHNMQYHEGLNVNCEETVYNAECNHGLFFSDEKHIMEFCGYGDLIADVSLPEGERISEYNGKYKAHQIILSNIRPLWTIKTFQELLESGADFHVSADLTLCYAAQKGDLNIVKYLVEQGLYIHAYEELALKLAADNGYFEIVKYLVEQGADIHSENDDALQCAATKNYLDITKFLVEQGADIHTCNDLALRFAASRGYLEIVKYLTEHGADIHAENNYALWYATKNNHTDVVEYLESLS